MSIRCDCQPPMSEETAEYYYGKRHYPQASGDGHPAAGWGQSRLPFLLSAVFVLLAAGCLHERASQKSGKTVEVLKADQCDVVITWFYEEIRAWPEVVYYTGDGPDRPKNRFLKQFHITVKEMAGLLDVLRPHLESEHNQETWMGIIVTSGGNKMYVGIPSNAKGLALLDAMAGAVRSDLRDGCITMRKQLAGHIEWQREQKMVPEGQAPLSPL